MTKREYFDLLVKTAREGGFPSVDLRPSLYSVSSCRYRSQDGKRCAIGILIPDGWYNSSMEGNNVYGILDRFHVWQFIPEGMTKDELYHVQKAHDELAAVEWDTEVFVNRLKALSCFEGI